MENENIATHQTYLVYFDETGDDGLNTKSSEEFILTAVYMNSNSWKENYYKIKELRRTLKAKYGFHISQEMHTKHFLCDKDPYRDYQWSPEEKREILIEFVRTISNLDIKIFSIVIDKTKIVTENFNILEQSLKYAIQRIENDSEKWNYIIITDKGRLSPMKKTARKMMVYNPIVSRFGGVNNKPIKNMIEDILEKDSKDSSFIQVCDFISYFTHLYINIENNKSFPKRVYNVVDECFVKRVFATFKYYNIINNKVSSQNTLGIKIHPINKT